MTTKEYIARIRRFQIPLGAIAGNGQSTNVRISNRPWGIPALPQRKNQANGSSRAGTLHCSCRNPSGRWYRRSWLSFPRLVEFLRLCRHELLSASVAVLWCTVPSCRLVASRPSRRYCSDSRWMLRLRVQRGGAQTNGVPPLSAGTEMSRGSGGLSWHSRLLIDCMDFISSPFLMHFLRKEERAQVLPRDALLGETA